MTYFAKFSNKARPIIPLTKDKLTGWCKKQSVVLQTWILSTGFKAAPGEICLVSGDDGMLTKILVGVSDDADLWDCGDLPKYLPKGTYVFQHPKIKEVEKWSLGWAIGAYTFSRYKTHKPTKLAKLVLPNSSKLEMIVEAIYLTRDLINTPAEDMGPAQLAGVARKLAKQHAAKFSIIIGDDLLKKNYPAIHAVGRAVTNKKQLPRLIDFKWGKSSDPKITLVGKGVCFDTGGLDLKSSAGMKLMKKDMGGAANVLGLAHMIMAAKLPLQLRVLIPAVENNVSGNAIRPSDVVTCRNGTTIEISNTDAEGRVILADALVEAASEMPEIIIDFATLTGAARVALGAEVPVLFTNDDKFAEYVAKTSIIEQDPLWRLPLWQGYRHMINGDTADLTNAPEGGYAGSITAALFLQEFIAPKTKWAHIDLMAWNLTAKPGRPRGGEAMAIRTIFNILENKFNAR
jgi:leucyl aminopeptidase